ncbi:MAG: UDP-N-acetylmuramoyl-L-alanine--D-glutamate ligase [Candidatus Eremiobacteraeota bacterium]|nr:UDP-N-acetylmuramoyl-L-alanine--D-glutamate ligase [Candidatus Eremiobacteraeota bacterium]
MTGSGFDASERVLVIGLGRSGRASCRVLRARGATVYAVDDKSRDELSDAIEEIAGTGAQFVAADALEPFLDQLTLAVLSPGIPLNSALVRRVQAARVPVYSEIEVAYRICAAPIVAVTGTKGKTTTTALIGTMLRSAGRTTWVGGNIGNALIEQTAQARPQDWVVAEVSSFQLESIRSFKPKIATILNISPDHLDRYHSMDEYAEAKFRIFANQGPGDTFVGNFDDPVVGALAWTEGGADRIPTRALWYARAPHLATALYLRQGRITYAPPTGDPRPIDIMPVDEIPLLGQHNVDNVMAAVLVGLAAGITPDVLRSAVRDFSPLPHRLERIAEIDGVEYVDDSKATNPSSVAAALSAFERPVVLIAGGKSKRTDFREICAAVTAHVRAVVLIGEAAEDLASALGDLTALRAGSMEEAVHTARSLAHPGDAVLLSPGCASFDMFESAEARGEAFRDAVLRSPVGAR